MADQMPLTPPDWTKVRATNAAAMARQLDPVGALLADLKQIALVHVPLCLREEVTAKMKAAIDAATSKPVR